MRPWSARALMLRSRGLLAGFDWSGFLRDAWGRHPVVLRQPFSEALLREQDFFEVLVGSRKALGRGDAQQVVLYDRDRVALSGASASGRSRSPLEPWLPLESDRGFDGYVERLRRDDRFERFGLFINRIHEHPKFWLQTREILAGLSEHLALPPTSLNTDVFIGNYAKTTFGAHRDGLDNLLFMVRGRRVLRLWSHEDFCTAMGECDADETFQDYTKAIPTSRAFELRAGDLLYWPADHWHVGEGDDELSISFNLDFPVPDDDDRVPSAVQRAVDRLVADAAENERVPSRAVFSGGMASRDAVVSPELLRIERAVARVRDAVASDRFELLVTREYLEWLTACWFDQVPAPTEGDSLSDEAWLRVDAPHPVRVAEVGEYVTLAACGHSAVVPACDAWLDLVGDLNRGEAVCVGELISRYAGTDSPSARGPMRVTADAVRWLLDALVRFRGAFVVDVGAYPGAEVSRPVGGWAVVPGEALRASTPSAAPVIVAEHGVAWIPDVLDPARCDRLAEYLKGRRIEASSEELGSIHANWRRYDLPLHLDPPVAAALHGVLDALEPMLTGAVGERAVLAELSSLTSLPGAKAQTEHPDSQFGDRQTAPLWTVFVNLDDVDASMGPLSVWPGSHRSLFFSNSELRREVLSAEREVELCLPKGAAVVMDSRTWHRGGANRSQRVRPVLYFSLLGEGTPPDGPTYTLRSELKRDLTLPELVDAVARKDGTAGAVR